MTQFVFSVALQDGTRVHDAVQADNAASARFILHYRYKDRYKSSDILSETVMPQAYECPVCHNTEHRPGALICKVCGEPLPAWLREQRPSMDMVNAYRTIGRHAFVAYRRRVENPKTVIIFADDQAQAMRKALGYFGYPQCDWERLSKGVGPIAVQRMIPTADAQVYEI